MTTDIYDITIDQGATFSLTITWEISSSPVDLTGYSARMQARHSVNASATFIDIDSGSEIVLGGVLGTLAITLSDTVTAAITEQCGVYDLELVSGAGVVTRLLQGSITVSREVTR